MKRIVSIILCCALIFSLAACGCVSERDNLDQTIVTKVYFVDSDMNFAAETRSVKLSDYAREIVEAVIEGPESTEWSKPIQGDVKVLSAETDENGVCTLNLSKEFAEANTGGTFRESIAIYAIVNSLCEVEFVKEVKLNIEGDTDYEFGGHFDFSDTFTKDENMIRIEDRN